LTESRKIARLLLAGVDEEHWNRAITKENILQKKSRASSIRIARLIKNRLTLANPELWQIIADANRDVATQAVLAVSIKHGRLLGEFMRRVLARHVKSYDLKLTPADWPTFFDECTAIDPNITNWSISTRNKLKQIVFRILAESKYIESVRSPRILHVQIADEVCRYLVNHEEHYVLSCMEATS
jgi:hypothetical protein